MDAKNKEDSARLAHQKAFMFGFGFGDQIQVKNLILATKKHEPLISDNSDSRYLLDLDLRILGTSPEMYATFERNIRKEYSRYSDEVYAQGRKQVLSSFLNRSEIYFTSEFKKYESQARVNVENAINLL